MAKRKTKRKPAARRAVPRVPAALRARLPVTYLDHCRNDALLAIEDAAERAHELVGVVNDALNALRSRVKRGATEKQLDNVRWDASALDDQLGDLLLDLAAAPIPPKKPRGAK